MGLVDAQQQQGAITVIQGATIITGTGSPVIRNGAIVIDGGRIQSIGPRNEVRVPGNAQVVDGRGKWVIPGLIDAHVHFSQSGGLYTRPDIIDVRSRRTYEKEMEWIKQRLPFTLERYILPASLEWWTVAVRSGISKFVTLRIARRERPASRLQVH
jgi:cytosine/adenosine deaminase-related metal-dependent hydrolase